MPRITELNLYPVKGMEAERKARLHIRATTGADGDRRTAFLRKPEMANDYPADINGFHMAQKWVPKGHFHVGMNEPRMVSLDYRQTTTTPELAEWVTAELNLPHPAIPVHTQGIFNLTDTQGPSVSLLNLATVRAFEQFLREKGELSSTGQLNPQRFRMNIHVDGMEPLAELDLATAFPGQREITIGNLRFRVDDACERCKATHANPDTGEYDLNVTTTRDGYGLLDAFMEKYRPYYRSPHRGKRAVMGILLVPLESGILHRGDKLLSL